MRMGLFEVYYFVGKALWKCLSGYIHPNCIDVVVDGPNNSKWRLTGFMPHAGTLGRNHLRGIKFLTSTLEDDNMGACGATLWAHLVHIWHG